MSVMTLLLEFFVKICEELLQTHVDLLVYFKLNCGTDDVGVLSHVLLVKVLAIV